jgi:hypothetical protein
MGTGISDEVRTADFAAVAIDAELWQLPCCHELCLGDLVSQKMMTNQN